MRGLASDLRFALRYFRRSPFAALTMIAVLAIGIGVNTAIFLIVYSLVNGPLPGVTAEPSMVRIRGIDRSNPGFTVGREFSYPEYLEYAAEGRLFSAVAAWTSSDVVIDVGSAEESLHSGAATYVTAGYFPILGVRPVVGAGLPPGSPDSGTPELVAVISHAVWERLYGRAPDVVGRTMKVNEVPVTIVGVAPRRFNGARTGGSQVRVWLPLNGRTLLQRADRPLAGDETARFGVVARLRPGIGPVDTAATVQGIAGRTPRMNARGVESRAVSTDVAPILADNYFPPSGEQPGIAGRVVTLMIPILILLITCTNVSALMAGLGLGRRREIAVRLSLGAPRRRIVRQLLTESVLLALVAGALGLFVVWALLRIFESSLGNLTIVLDQRGLAFTFGVAVVAGIVFGLSPALHATRLALSGALKDAAGSMVTTRSRLQSTLVVTQIALTQPALLAMGGLILNMRADLAALPSPVFADRILDVWFNTNPRYGAMDQNRQASLNRVRDRFAALPGVVAVVPQAVNDGDVDLSVHPADVVTGVTPEATLYVRTHAAPSPYFALMGIPFVRGRGFAPAGEDDAGTVVIGADLARRFWGEADPIGRRLIGAARPGQLSGTFVVIGVVDEAAGGVARAPGDTPRVFTPTVGVTGHFLVRTEGPAQPTASAIRSAANDEAPELPVVSVNTLAAIEREQRRSIVTAVAAVAGSGGVALLLSAIGLYAVVAVAVGQRVREIGIRSALGADSRRIVGLFVKYGLRLGVVGLAIGLALSIAVLQIMNAAMGEASPDGIVTLAMLVALIVVGVALFATWIPARRAAAVDPLAALRAE